MQLGEEKCFKYLYVAITKEVSCTVDVHLRIMAAVMARLNKIWDSRSVSFCTIFRLYKS